MRLRARSFAAAEERDFELLGLLLLFVGPFAAVIGNSLLNWEGLTTPRFAGVSNYGALFHDNIADDGKVYTNVDAQPPPALLIGCQTKVCVGVAPFSTARAPIFAHDDATTGRPGRAHGKGVMCGKTRSH
jgi:ABC-type sugar transport system permease subunit